MIPGSANPLLLKSAAAGGLQISRSIRLNSADSAYFSRTPAVAGNRKTWTWSGWVKRSALGVNAALFGRQQSDDTNTLDIRFGPGDTLRLANFNSYLLETTQVFRDTSAWFHLVLALDTTQATANNRARMYVNGVEVTQFGARTNPTQNADLAINSTTLHHLGATVSGGGATYYFPGYLANIHFIDGQALTPSSFTETDATTGQLIPKTYTGSYGTNGFNLLFADNSSNTASTLGKDYSGLGNNWTPNNLSVTAGAGNDSLVDSPTNYGTDTGVGGEVRGNYCTLNPLASTGTNSNGNLDGVTNPAKTTHATFALPATGKWYFETVMTNSGLLNVGLAAYKPDGNIYLISNSVLYSSSGVKNVDGVTDVPYGATFASGDIIGVACNADTGSVTFYKNNVSQGAITHQVSGLFPSFGNGSLTTNCTVNFGQRAFAYTAPSGFKALCTQNLPSPLVTKSNTAMDVVAYTGTGATRSITGLAFSPDLVWIKSRNNAGDANGVWHILTDIVRGNSKNLFSNATNAEVSNDSNGYLSAFTSDGFTLTAGSSTSNNVNNSTGTYVAWTWDAGTSTVSNTAGSITSQVRANPTAGFSVVTYTGTGSSATVGHGLGVAPGMVIVKRRNSTGNWQVRHTSIAVANSIQLNLTSAAASATTVWNSTAPSSTVFSIGTDATVNGSGGTYVAYCFAPVVGYSSFGSYTGNGSTDGPFVYTGFRPRWILYKRSDSGTGSGNWNLVDTSRSTYNVSQTEVIANDSIAEFTSSNANMDILSNGFKIRTTDASRNESAKTFIYAAFAEAPLNYSRAR